MQRQIASALYRALAAYTRRSPLRRGKGTLIRALRRTVPLQAPILVRARDGRLFEVRHGSAEHQALLFFGEVDRGETEIVRHLLRPGDVAVDVGANEGWYTTLCAQLVGPTGRVLAIEPVPGTFGALARAVALNQCGGNVVLVCALCGAAEAEEGVVYEFPAAHSGVSSIRPLPGMAAVAHRAPVVTLDQLLSDERVARVRLLKLDVEGAELAVLRGARSLLAQGRVDVVMLELNEERAGAFGYAPSACLELLRESGFDYEVLGMAHGRPALFRTDRLREGNNVLCVRRGSDAWDAVAAFIRD